MTTVPQPNEEQPRTSTLWVVCLWVLMSIWMGFVIYRAASELRNDQVVIGLFRDYHPPYERDDGWVIDPSARTIDEEIHRRFSPKRTHPPPTLHTPEAWMTWLDHVGIEARIQTGSAPDGPHLRFTATSSTPELWIGRYGLDFIVFSHRIGVIQRPELDAASAIIQLLDVEVMPW